MAIYNAYCDRVPIYMIVGDHEDGAERNPGVQSLSERAGPGRASSAITPSGTTQPYSLGAFAESAVRAYKIAMTPPMGPVLIVAGAEIQSHAMQGPAPRIPKLVLTTPPAGDMAAVNEAAWMLVAAERPMIIPERYARTPEGVKLLIELAETLQAPVNNRSA